MLDNLDYLNIKQYKKVYRNLSIPELMEFAIKRGEGILSDKGALVVNTGKYTGRSPKDRFIVKDEITEADLNWNDVNLPIDADKFEKIHEEVLEYLKGKDLFVFDGHVGASKKYSMPIRVICEYAYQAMFANHMFRRLDEKQLDDHKPEFNIIVVPGLDRKSVV